MPLQKQDLLLVRQARQAQGVQEEAQGEGQVVSFRQVASLP